MVVTMQLRDYQIRTLDAVWAAMQHQTAALIVAPCSAGKTILFSKLIQRLLRENPGFRALILVDREVLVTQAADKLRRVAPELVLSIGIACAGADKVKTLDQPVTIASRQTLDRLMDRFAPVQLCILDEAHLLAIPHPDKQPDQYGRIIGRLRDYNPNMRLVGCTATPYRLGGYGGYIYGKGNRPDSRPYWMDVTTEISTRELLAGGFIAPLRGLARENEGLNQELKFVNLSGGEYNLGQLSNLMCREVHVRSVVEAWRQEAADRKKTIVFTTTKEHASAVCAAFAEAGVEALPIHSGLPPVMLANNMAALEEGDGTGVRVFVSIAMLTTGLDVVDVDCLILARPTKSAALYKQILGRGQRLAPGKTDCLVIDLVGSFRAFGTDMDKIRVTIPSGAKGGAPYKLCPNEACNQYVHPSLRYCPHCGEEFPMTELVEAALGNMREVKFNEDKPPVEPDVYEVRHVDYEIHVSRSSGKRLIRVVYDCGSYHGGKSEWVCLPDYYDGYAVAKAMKWWERRSAEPFPETVEEFLFLSDTLMMPRYISVVQDGRFERVVEASFEEYGEEPAGLPAPQYNEDEIPF